MSDVEVEDIGVWVAPTEPVVVDFRVRPPVRAFTSLDSGEPRGNFQQTCARDAFSPSVGLSVQH